MGRGLMHDNLEDWDQLCPPAFRALIDILPRPAGAAEKWNGIRWQFSFAEDHDVLPPDKVEHADIWPLFRQADGSPISSGINLEGQLEATMHIVMRPAKGWFKAHKFGVGTRFYCCEGHTVFAQGRVTEILDLGQLGL